MTECQRFSIKIATGTTTICGVIDGGDWPTAAHENINDAKAKKRRIFIGLYNIPSGAAEVAYGSLCSVLRP